MIFKKKKKDSWQCILLNFIKGEGFFLLSSFEEIKTILGEKLKSENH